MRTKLNVSQDLLKSGELEQATVRDDLGGCAQKKVTLGLEDRSTAASGMSTRLILFTNDK